MPPVDNSVRLLGYRCGESSSTSLRPRRYFGSTKKSADVKESFEVGREDDEVMPNIWFSEDILPGFRETCLTFFWV